MVTNSIDRIYLRADHYLQIIHLLVLMCAPEPGETKEMFEFKQKIVDTVLDELRRVPSYGSPDN